MPLPNRRNRLTRLLLGGAFVLVLGLLFVLAQNSGPGYAAPPALPDPKHRTPTVTPTVTPTPGDGELSAQSAASVEIDPFIGYESVPAFSTFLSKLCGDAIVAPGGEAWVLSESVFYVGDPDIPNGATLYAQRCVGDFQNWEGIGSLNPPAVAHLLPPSALYLPTSVPSVARILELRPDAFRVLPTPVPVDRPPVLAPVFRAPFIPIVPTIEAPDRFQLMPPTSVVLRTPGGQEIVLSNAAPNRPDLWSYTFPINSSSGVYELILTSNNNSQTRQIYVSGAPRIYTTDRNGALADEFLTPSAAWIVYADFTSGREVSVLLYRVVENLAVDLFSHTALAEVGRWSFTPGDQPTRERFSQRLAPGPGPVYGNFVLLACYTDECNQIPRIAVTSRRVIWPRMALGSLFLRPDASVLTLPDSFETIRFAPGGIDALVELTLSDSSPAGYQLRANAGQRMRVELDTPNVQVYALDPSGELLLPSGQGVGVWEFTLQQSGQHRLLVYGVEDGHMTITIPPGSAPPTPAPPPTPPPTPTAAPPPSTDSLRDALLEKMAGASTPNDYPNQANALVEHLLAQREDFDRTGIGSATLLNALNRADVGERLNGIVHAVWKDWSGVSGDPLNDNPAGLSPFRQLVARLIQGSIGILSAQEQRAILSWLTRSESPSVWRDNPNGVIGAINREIFP